MELAMAGTVAAAGSVFAFADASGSDMFGPTADFASRLQVGAHAPNAWIAVALIAAGGLLSWLLAACVTTTLWKPYRLVSFCKEQGIPFLPFRPLIGHILDIRAAGEEGSVATEAEAQGDATETAGRIAPHFWKWSQKYGKVFGFCIGHHPRLVFLDPNIARQILVSNAYAYEKTALTRKNIPLLGNGIGLSEGEFWARQRRMINSAFHLSRIQGMIATMDEVARASVARWVSRVERQGEGATLASSSKPSAAELEMHQELSGVALEIIGRTAFGAKAAAGEGKSGVEGGDGGGGSIDAALIYNALTRSILMRMDLLTSGRLLIPFYSSLPTWENMALHKEESSIRQATKDLIKHRREALQRGEPPGNDLLASMLAARDDETNERMDDQQLMDECLTLFLTGHETTGQLLTWTMYLLALHPEWQDKLREEVVAALDGRPETEFADESEGKEGRNSEGKDSSEEGEASSASRGSGSSSAGLLSWGVLARLQKMTMVFQEAMRMYPPVPIVSRQCMKENNLGNFKIPVGVGVVVPITVLHYDRDLWGDDVNLFRPERFKDGVASSCKNPTAYIPFGLGPRTCIGSLFAMTEAKVVLLRTLQCLSWSLSPGYRHQPQNHVTLRPKYGMPLVMKPLQP